MRASLVVASILLTSLVIAAGARGVRVRRLPPGLTAFTLARAHAGPRAHSSPASILASGAFTAWREAGFVALRPTIPLPGDAAGRFRTEILVHLPEGAAIGGDASGWAWPAGARLDRIEWLSESGAPRIADVRATELVDVSGRVEELFFAYRPSARSADAPLAGGRYARGDERGRAALASGFRRLAAMGGVFLAAERGSRDEHRAASLARLEETHRCASCHAHDVPEADAHDDRWLRRGTDAMGFYVPHYVMRDDAPMERYRPMDRSAESRFVRVMCGDDELPRQSDRTSIRCPDGSTPRLRLDVAAGVAARDEHTLAVCASRRWLAAHMTPAARAPHVAAIAACGGAE